LKMEELVFRSWYYFRNGYSTYLSFPVAFVTFVSTTYYLAVKNIPFLKGVFSHFYLFVVMAIALLFPLGAFIGWLHMKRTLAYPAQMAVNVESNPYNYKIMPGKESEVVWPIWHLLLRMMERMSEKESIISMDEKRELEELLLRIEILKNGGVVDTPRQRSLLKLSSGL